MRRYLIADITVALVLTLASFVVMWCMPQAFLAIMPVVPLYFAVVTAVQHHLVVKAAYGDARKFVKTFLGSTVAVMLLHLVVLALFMFTHLQQARLFVLAFAIAYFVYLVFETVVLVRFVKRAKNE